MWFTSKAKTVRQQMPPGGPFSIGLFDAERKGVGQHAIDIALFHVTLEVFGAGAGGLQYDIIDGMYA